LQFSVDGTNWRATDTYTVAATTVLQLSLPIGAQYFRVVYTNGGTTTTTLNIQIIYNEIAGNPSSSRPGDAMTNENDSVDVLARLAGFNGTTWDRLRTTGTGVLQVSAAVTSLPTLATVTTVGTVTTLANGQTANGATMTGNPLRIGAAARTALPTAVTDGQAVNITVDKFGRQVIAEIPGLQTTQQTTLTASTTETTIGTAVASTFLDLTSLTITNSSASTGTTVTVRNATAGTIVWGPQFIAPSTGAHVNFPYPLEQATANNNWTIQCGTSTSSIYVSAVFKRRT